MKYYKLSINQTAKNIGSKDDYLTFNYETKEFNTINEVKEYLRENYQDCKKVKMYQDKKDGTSYQTGWIYCFKNKDISHDSNWWYQQDWVSLYQINSKNILI